MFIGQLLTFKNAVQICPHESCYHVSSDYNENSNKKLNDHDQHSTSQTQINLFKC